MSRRNHMPLRDKMGHVWPAARCTSSSGPHLFKWQLFSQASKASQYGPRHAIGPVPGSACLHAWRQLGGEGVSLKPFRHLWFKNTWSNKTSTAATQQQCRKEALEYSVVHKADRCSSRSRHISMSASNASCHMVTS